MNVVLQVVMVVLHYVSVNVVLPVVMVELYPVSISERYSTGRHGGVASCVS